ncbi:hypothetical protein ACWEFL_02720 [Streptomyces sp. NPDC004838]
MTGRARTVAERLAIGSTIVARHRSEAIAAWISAGRRDDLTGWRAALGPTVRMLLLAGAAYAALALLRAVPWLMWLLTAWWLRAAWKAAAKPAEAHGEPADDDTVYDAALDWIRDQIDDRNGVHLVDLLEHAHTHGMLTELDLPAFRAAMERWGFPVRQQLKVAGRNRPGIHRDDLPSTTSPTATEGAPEAA